MTTASLDARISNRRWRRTVGPHQDVGFRQTLQILARPRVWLLCMLFFLVATPFELDRSGFAYFLKASAILAMIAYAVFARGARIGKVNPLIILLVVTFFLTNLVALSDRALLATAAILTGALLGQIRGSDWNDEFLVAVSVYLVVHVAGLLVAAALFYSAGQVVELHGMIFPQESRAEAHGLVGRVAGFHNEPGTYSQWTLMALFLLSLMRGRLYSFWSLMIALSLVLTVSLWGVLAFGAFVVAITIEALISTGKAQRTKTVLSVFLFAAVVAILLINASTDIVESALEFITLKGSMTTQSGLDKLWALEFMQREFWDVFVIGRPLVPGFCPYCHSPQDAGLGMTGTYYLGFLLFTLLIIVLAATAYSKWNIGFAVPLALILVWKAHLYEPLLFIIIGYILKGPVFRRLLPSSYNRARGNEFALTRSIRAPR